MGPLSPLACLANAVHQVNRFARALLHGLAIDVPGRPDRKCCRVLKEQEAEYNMQMAQVGILELAEIWRK